MFKSKINSNELLNSLDDAFYNMSDDIVHYDDESHNELHKKIYPNELSFSNIVKVHDADQYIKILTPDEHSINEGDDVYLTILFKDFIFIPQDCNCGIRSIVKHYKKHKPYVSNDIDLTNYSPNYKETIEDHNIAMFQTEVVPPVIPKKRGGRPKKLKIQE